MRDRTNTQSLSAKKLTDREERKKDVGALLAVALLPIARMLLRNGFGAGELISAAKLASVRAALIEVIPAGSRINVSRLSVATGLTRKEISNQLGQKLKPKSILSKPTPEQRAWRVLRGWYVDPEYRERNGRLIALPFLGKHKSFSALVKQYGGDVTPVSVLRELERIRVITKTRSGTFRLRSGALESRGLVTQQIADLASIFKDFATTITGVEVINNSQRTYFEFKDAIMPWADQAALFQRTFAKRGAILIGSFDQWLKSQRRSSRKAAQLSKPSVRIGLGVYLVQDTLPGNALTRAPDGV